VASGLVLFAYASNELRQLSKMPQLLAPAVVFAPLVEGRTYTRAP